MSTIKVNNLVPPNTGETVTINGVDMPTAGALSNRNMIINGAMQVAQRIAAPNTQPGVQYTGYYTVDRFQTGVSLAGTWTISQSTDAPAGFSNSIKYDCTAAATSLSSTSELWLAQKIEAISLQHLAYGTADAQDCTFSFYFKTNKTGVYTVELFQTDAGRTIGFEMNVTQTGWQRYEFVVPGDTAGTINRDNGIGLWCFIWMASGTGKTSGSFTNGTWGGNVNTNRLSPNMVNFADSTSNELYVTGYQFELGRKATPFEHRSYGDELQRCERYFQTYGPVFGITFSNYSGGSAYGALHLRTEMRSPPTIHHLTAFNSTHLNYYSNGGTGRTLTSFGLNQGQPHVCQFVIGSANLGGQGFAGHLDINQTNAIQIQAEL